MRPAASAPHPSDEVASSQFPELRGRHIVFLSWRDLRNPEGGGAERYLEQMAVGLVRRGARVTVFSAAHDSAPGEEVREGVRYVRRGSKMSVYPQGFWSLVRRRFGRVDLVVDVQNGLPFFSRLATRVPVVVLVHHVHREQWPVVYPGLVGRVGWWAEHVVAPWLYRTCQYVAVSRATRDELADQGVAGHRVAVVHNGTEPRKAATVGKSSTPTIAVVGRLVPHKQVEHAVDAAVSLRREFPDLAVEIVGDGWWAPSLRRYVAEHGAEDIVTFHGFVDEHRKHELYERAWVLALPSLKEGWGLVVGEAGMHRTPTVAYRSAGGTGESIADGDSGLLVDSSEEFQAALRRLLTDRSLRQRLGSSAEAMSHAFSWGCAQESFAGVISGAMRGEFVQGQDPATRQGPMADLPTAVGQ